MQVSTICTLHNHCTTVTAWSWHHPLPHRTRHNLGEDCGAGLLWCSAIHGLYNHIRGVSLSDDASYTACMSQLLLVHSHLVASGRRLSAHLLCLWCGVCGYLPPVALLDPTLLMRDGCLAGSDPAAHQSCRTLSVCDGLAGSCALQAAAGSAGKVDN